MKKKGASNVEFVIAFILFITVVGASFYLFNPTKNVKAREQSSTYVFGKIIENTTVEVASYALKINQGCDPIISFELSEPIKGSARVEDYYGNELPSGRSENVVYFNRGNNDFVIVLLSEDFEEGSQRGSLTNPSCYSLATYALNYIISENRLVLLNKSYYANYNALKTQLNIPNNLDFDFSVTFSDNSTIIAQRNVPTTTDIFASGKRVEVIRKDGTSDFADLVTRIW